MFFRKIIARISRCEEAFEHQAKAISAIQGKLLGATVSCETCGCLVLNEEAIKGKSEVKSTWAFYLSSPLCSYDPPTEYLYTPYYCRACAPKGEKSKKK